MKVHRVVRIQAIQLPRVLLNVVPAIPPPTQPSGVPEENYAKTLCCHSTSSPLRRHDGESVSNLAWLQGSVAGRGKARARNVGLARPVSASWATRAVSVKGVSPVAWQHVNLFGTIEFSRTPLSIDIDALARYDDPDYWNRALRGISTTAE
jgi:hypothetical protein